MGRAKRVAMADLRQLLGALGYDDVTTVLQSGNAVFTAPDAAVPSAAEDIEQAVAHQLGVQCRVLVRTGAELAAAIAADPLGAVATDPSRHLLGFLESDPAPCAIAAIRAIEVAPDAIRLVGRHVYLWCPAGVLASPLSTVPWQRSLGVAVTMRNWNTATKLNVLAAPHP